MIYQANKRQFGALGVPYWAQNAVLAWAENWRATKAEYFDAAMARRGITCSGAEG